MYMICKFYAMQLCWAAVQYFIVQTKKVQGLVTMSFRYGVLILANLKFNYFINIYAVTIEQMFFIIAITNEKQCCSQIAVKVQILTGPFLFNYTSENTMQQNVYEHELLYRYFFDKFDNI